MTNAYQVNRLKAAKPAMMPAWSNGAGRVAALANDGSTLAERRMR
jgi:hypothetical protein